MQKIGYFKNYFLVIFGFASNQIDFPKNISISFEKKLLKILYRFKEKQQNFFH